MSFPNLKYYPIMKYDSDLTDSQWEVIVKIFDDKDISRKRKHLLKEIVDAILYLSKSGAQWCLLPNDFSKWQLVYYYFRTWKAKGLVQRIHDPLRDCCASKGAGRQPPAWAYWIPKASRLPR